jgi:integrase
MGREWGRNCRKSISCWEKARIGCGGVPPSGRSARPVHRRMLFPRPQRRGGGHADGCTESHANQSKSRVLAMLAGCRFVFLSDLSASRLAEWLNDSRQAGRSIQTSNHYLVTMKAFVNWLVKDGRTGENPFRHLERGNAATDKRHDRRDLLPDELAELFEAARSGPELQKLAGADRSVLYATAAFTGLRSRELASLSPESFQLDAKTPAVTVLAGYSKRRREDTVPLHPELLTVLRPWLAGKAPGSPLWPGKWASGCHAGQLLKRVYLAPGRRGLPRQQIRPNGSGGRSLLSSRLKTRAVGSSTFTAFDTHSSRNSSRQAYRRRRPRPSPGTRRSPSQWIGTLT